MKPFIRLTGAVYRHRVHPKSQSLTILGYEALVQQLKALNNTVGCTGGETFTGQGKLYGVYIGLPPSPRHRPLADPLPVTRSLTSLQTLLHIESQNRAEEEFYRQTAKVEECHSERTCFQNGATPNSYLPQIGLALVAPCTVCSESLLFGMPYLQKQKRVEEGHIS